MLFFLFISNLPSNPLSVMMQQQFVFITIVFFSVIISSFSKSNTISLTQPLPYGKTLVSSNEMFALGFFTPSIDSDKHYLGIWYNKVPTQTIIWVANRENPIHGNTGLLSISNNGTLLITSGNSNVIWSSSSSYSNTVTDPVAVLLDSGNFLVTDGYDGKNNFFAWQSFDYPTDTLVPGMKLGWNLTSGLNRNLTSWSSSSDPSRGNFTVAMDLRGDPQLIFWAGSTRRFRSGPWTGQYFSGLAPDKPNIDNVLLFDFVDTKQEVYFAIEPINTSSISRLVLNSLGVFQQFVLLGSGQWGLYWYAPRSQCNSYLICGPYGAGCYVDTSPMCSCLPGYIPKSTGNWALRDWSGGCVRKTKLDCRNLTDGFVKVQRTLLPDTVSATVNSGLSLSDCRDVCLKNCSCTAYASADTSDGGSGCIIWSTELSDILVYANGGQDLFMRLAAADLGLVSSNQSHKKSKATIAIVLCLTLGMFILVSIVLFAWRTRRRTGGNTFIGENVVENTGEDEMELPLFDLETIVEATNDFSDKNKLGEGGFGPVYKGIAREGHEIAVKRLSKTSSQGFDELRAEVILVAKLQHRNLVRLLGCCIQGDERMLIYEYMPNRSLDAFLFDEEKAILLDWASRYHIIVGIARGLLYLHQDSRFRIIHRDLKASNILLDKDMNPKISDFGLARIFGEDETKTKTARVVGTYGYMAPEYALNGIISVKSDVFSFGVLVLEIISGKRNKGVYLSNADEYLLGRAWSLWREGNGVQLVSSSIQHSICIDEVVRCIKVGLLCIQERPEDRPTMSSVCLMLSSENTNLPQPQQPAFLLRRNSPRETTSSDSNSINDLTITMTMAR